MKNRTTSDGMMVRPKESYERPKPTFTVTEKELPEIKTWEVGKKYPLEIEVEMVSHSKGDTFGMEEGKQHEARLRVTKIDAKDDSDDYES